MNQSAASFLTFISIATGGLIFIAFIIILFVIFYQRKIFSKQNQLDQLTIENQKQLLNAVLTTKESEQKRIAQELHDEIGSSVNSLKMHLHTLPIEELSKYKIADELVLISKNIRRISNDLMPAVLEELGLVAALKHICKRFQDATQIKFIYTENVNLKLSLTKIEELSMYRILQELFTNICKYSTANLVEIELKNDFNDFSIRVFDNGTGFIPSKENYTSSKDSLGLKNIQSRIQQLGATIHYEYGKPKGTIVTLTLKNKQDDHKN